MRIRTELEYGTSYRPVRPINGLRAPNIRVPRFEVAAWQSAPRGYKYKYGRERMHPMINALRSSSASVSARDNVIARENSSASASGIALYDKASAKARQ